MSRHMIFGHMRLGGAIVAVALFVGFFIAVPVQAASRHVLSLPASVTELAKVTLDETSVNAPGFYGNAQLGTSEVIAWAGTDAAHHLNVMTSTDGLHYSHKVTLAETSINRPGVVQMPQSAGGAVALAWRGTDAAHHLNVLFDVYGSPKKLIVDETSFTGPSIAVFKGDLMLAWAGTDPSHSLNVLPIHISSLTPGTVTTMSQFSASAGPTLSVVNIGNTSTLVLSWTTPTSRLDEATSTDGVHFTSGIGNSLPETSPSSPSMLFFQTEGGPGFWIAWTGTDSAHHLNVARLQGF